RPASLAVDRWLLKLALEQITAEVKRLKASRGDALSLEGPPPQDGEGVGDEIYEFYQPDEKLRLEDILPAPEVPTPEQVAENRELQRYINQTLAQLPRVWRIVFMLHHVEDFSIPDIALVTGLDPVTVERYLEYARAFLQQKMREVLSEEAVGSGETTHRFFATAVEVEVPESLRTRVQTQILESQAS
ncbi:MAG: sigma-70 family RNA polymerase sigma factor, partial [Nitrospinota bacterium]